MTSSSFQRIYSLIKKELLTILKDPKSRMLILLPPILQLLIFAHAATMEIKNINVAILDKSDTVQSRELTAGFEQSMWFHNIIKAKNENEINHYIRSQKAHIALEIQNDFARKLLSNRQTTLQIIADGRQTNTASIASGYAQEVIANYEREFKKYKKEKTPSIELRARSWYNPNLEYLWYTVVSLIAIISLSTTLLLTSMSIAREREIGTFDQLIVSPMSAVEILAGKTIPPLVITVSMTFVVACIVAWGFKVPFEGSAVLLLFATIISLLSIVGVGLFISSICKTQQQALLGVFVFQMPAILLSGYISPIYDMPVFVQHLTYLNPTRFYLVIIKGIYQKNMGAEDVFYNLIPLVILSIITLSIATWMFKKNLD